MPRRRALEIALLRAEAADDPVDHRTLGVAVHDLLHLLCERNPVLLAIDDAQWLDAASSGALAFALRRLAPRQVHVLLARRLVDDGDLLELERALPADRVVAWRCATSCDDPRAALARAFGGILGRPVPAPVAAAA